MWENSTKSKYVKILINNQNIMLGYPFPMEKTQKIENVKQLILMNVENDFFIDPFLPSKYHLFSQTLRALLRNKNGILHFCKKSIIQ